LTHCKKQRARNIELSIHRITTGEEIAATLDRAKASDATALRFLATLPAERRQPNLFLAAVRHLFGVPDSGEQLIDIVRRKHELIRELMLSRTTQTNAGVIQAS
jgi:hypothetical protein